MSREGTTGTALERRNERRIAVHLPMRVRGTDHAGVRFEDLTSSENLCRTGAAFCTTRQLEVGADLEITIPMPKSDSDFATRGRVVHVEPGRSQHERIIGVEFTGPRFHRVFMAENNA